MGTSLFLLMLCLLRCYVVQGGQQRACINDETEAIAWLEDYNQQGMVVYSDSTIAAWDFYTDLTDEHQALMVSYPGLLAGCMVWLCCMADSMLFRINQGPGCFIS